MQDWQDHLARLLDLGKHEGGRILVDGSTISQALARLADGVRVYDANGETIGRVRKYVPGSEWIAVDNRALAPEGFCVPLTVVASLNTDGVHLCLTKDVLSEAFVVPPANAPSDAVKARPRVSRG